MTIEDVEGAAAPAPAPAVEEPPAPGLELAARDVESFVSAIINSPQNPYEKNSVEFIMCIKLSQKERIDQWQKLKATMGKEEFMRIGYCDDCAVEANITFRKDIATKCARHSA